jgi:nickel-type superoxide dismutase maturation protease
MILIRRVVGRSMYPALKEGKIVVAKRSTAPLLVGDVIIVRHGGVEKIKRIKALEVDKIYIVGDNEPESTDSRQFGWVNASLVQGKVVWPINRFVRQKPQK